MKNKRENDLFKVLLTDAYKSARSTPKTKIKQEFFFASILSFFIVKQIYKYIYIYIKLKGVDV